MSKKNNKNPIVARINDQVVDYEYKRRRIRSWGHPQSVNFLMIDKCNSQCVMCGDDYYAKKTGKILTFEKYKKMLSNLNMKKVRKIVYGGAGDPLLSTYLPEIVEYTASRYKHIQLRVITNAIALDEKLSRMFLKNDVFFTISINATTAKTYHSIHGVDFFDKVYANVKRLTQLRNEMGSESTVELSAVLTRRNIEELPDFVNMTKDLDCVAIKVLFCRYYPELLRFKKNDDKAERLLEEESLYFHKELTMKYMLETKKRAADYGIKFWSEPLFGSKAPPHPCYSPWKTIYIGFDGEVYPCPAGEVLFYERVKNGYYDTGNLLEQNIKEVWNNEFYQKLRATDSACGVKGIEECACCGNSINWLGPDNIRSHILDWSKVLEGVKPPDAKAG